MTDDTTIDTTIDTPLGRFDLHDATTDEIRAFNLRTRALREFVDNQSRNEIRLERERMREEARNARRQRIWYPIAVAASVGASVGVLLAAGAAVATYLLTRTP